ncbi:LysR family transcriptional regulator [Pigmentiphaga soli]|uniref:LysR family transcriptional regulator n=1 Tax=Pigmentiphaga soli TaxID=1007095 RepID=A0ABP8HFJ3_9BURK
MDTTYLRTFELVVQTGSMAEAARRLHLSPTAVAKQLHALEREFGVALTARSGRTVLPTEAGHNILALGRSVLGDIQEMKRRARAGQAAGEFRLGSINTFLHGLVPDMLASLVHRHPGLRVFVQPGSSAYLYDALHNEQVDAAICLHPQFELPKTLWWAGLRREPLVALVPAALRHEDPHTLLEREPLIRLDRRQWGGRLAEEYLRQAGIRPIERFELSSLPAISKMVDRGLGVSLVPDIEQGWPAGLRIRRLALPLPTQPREVGLLCLRSSSRLDLVQELVGDYHAARRAASQAPPAAAASPPPTNCALAAP